jgi:hypothetical protein
VLLLLLVLRLLLVLLPLLVLSLSLMTQQAVAARLILPPSVRLTLLSPSVVCADGLWYGP